MENKQIMVSITFLGIDFTTWQHVTQLAMIRRGWSMCGSEQTFNKTFHANVM
jgi:hypothetical protein